MDRYVIRDTNNCEFLEMISNAGVKTTDELTDAIIFEDLEQAIKLLEFINDDDFIIAEIEFKFVKELENEK